MINSSLLKIQSESQIGYHESKYNNPYLRIGTVTKVVRFDEKGNVSKKADEYEVVCVEQKSNSGMTQVLYRSCTLSSSFGSAVDFAYSRHTASSNRSDILNGNNKDTSEGSVVLLLCADGFIEHPIIIGALPHPDAPAPLKDNALNWQYNDVNFRIEDSGEITLVFNKTKTSLKITKDGDFNIFLADGFELKMIQKDGKVSLTVPEAISIATKNISVDTKESVTIKFKGFNLEGAESALKIKQIKLEGSSFSIKTKSLKIKSNNVVISGSNVDIKGDVINLKGQVFVGGPGGLPAVTSLSQITGLGNLGAPVISMVTGGFSSKVFIAS